MWITIGLGVALALVILPTPFQAALRSIVVDGEPTSKTTTRAGTLEWSHIEVGDFAVSLPGTPVRTREQKPESEGSLRVEKYVVQRPKGEEFSAALLTVPGNDCKTEGLLDKIADDVIREATLRSTPRVGDPQQARKQITSVASRPARSIEMPPLRIGTDEVWMSALVIAHGCQVLIVVAATTPLNGSMADAVLHSIKRPR